MVDRVRDGTVRRHGDIGNIDMDERNGRLGWNTREMSMCETWETEKGLLHFLWRFQLEIFFRQKS